VKLYFIPTASDVEEDKFFVCKSMDDLQAAGVNPIWYSLKLKTREQVKRELADADVIWVNGGNTFYLLDIARKVGFMEVVGDLVRNKGVRYGGTSAGTILATPDIAIAGWGEDSDTNDVGIDDLRALDFVKILTQVHYKSDEHRAMLQNQPHDLPIYALADGTAVEVNGDEIVTHGAVEIL
jgi:dipeptidase E